MRARENKCQISQNNISHMKFSEFYLCFRNSCEIWHLFKIKWQVGLRIVMWLYTFYLLLVIICCWHITCWRIYIWSSLYYAWVQMLLQMGPLLHLGPVITLVPSSPDYKSSSLHARPRCFHSIVCMLLDACFIKLTTRSKRKGPALKERVSELNGRY